jgi:predicted hydrocarbon binding protein
MFETVTGKPVEVTLTESIRRGGEACRFTIRI